jgi:CDP-4-dehydro-6-deoxyglucose reductase
MAFNVTLKQSGRQFQVESDETVLAAALRQNVHLPYGCKNGACGSCKGQIVSGQIEQGPHAASALSNDERTRGLALLCCSKAQCDLEIDVREIAGVDGVQVKKLPCRIAALERKADDVMVVKLQLPANERLQYLAGQYVEFILKDGSRRSYSMANAPHEEGPIELHIRHMPGGKFTDHVFGAMKERDILRFEGPLGTFFLREESDKPIVLLASGTGFAPIKAILERIQDQGITRPVTLYWGCRSKADLYLNDWAEAAAAAMPTLRYVPVLSEPKAEDGWTGRTGFVHQVVMADLPDLSRHQIYACGAPVMVESAQRDFVARCGLPPEEFYADAFTSELDKHGG